MKTVNHQEYGKVKLEEVSIQYQSQEDDKIDIQLLVNSISLYESIYSKHTTGKMLVIDARHLIKNLSLTGQELLTIKYRLPYKTESGKEEVIERKFRIYKITNVSRQKESDVLQGYNIFFCEPNAFRTKEERISKTLRGSHKQMIESLFTDLEISEDVQNIEETEGDKHQFIVPNWSINKTLDWVVNNANPLKKNSYKNSMFFYQTLDGQYHFKSMDSMLEETYPYIFSHNIKVNNNQISEEEKNRTILQTSKPQEFDTLHGTSTGTYSSMLKVYDPIRKIEEINVYDIKDTASRRNEVSENTADSETQGSEIKPLVSSEEDTGRYGEKPFAKRKFNTTILNDYTTTHAFDNAKKLSDTEIFEGIKNIDNSRLERHSLMGILQQNRIEVMVPLQTEVQVGQKIKLGLPLGQVAVENSPKVQEDSTYLIISLATHINAIDMVGTTNLECSKESRVISGSVDTAELIKEMTTT
jgi:hypothetical protein